MGKVFVLAVLLDTGYQIFVLAFYSGQAIIVAVACAIVPYVLVRGPVTRLAGLFNGQKREPTSLWAIITENAASPANLK